LYYLHDGQNQYDKELVPCYADKHAADYVMQFTAPYTGIFNVTVEADFPVSLYVVDALPCASEDEFDIVRCATAFFPDNVGLQGDRNPGYYWNQYSDLYGLNETVKFKVSVLAPISASETVFYIVKSVHALWRAGGAFTLTSQGSPPVNPIVAATLTLQYASRLTNRQGMFSVNIRDFQYTVVSAATPAEECITNEVIQIPPEKLRAISLTDQTVVRFTAIVNEHAIYSAFMEIVYASGDTKGFYIISASGDDGPCSWGDSTAYVYEGGSPLLVITPDEVTLPTVNPTARPTPPTYAPAPTTPTLPVSTATPTSTLRPATHPGVSIVAAKFAVSMWSALGELVTLQINGQNVVSVSRQFETHDCAVFDRDLTADQFGLILPQSVNRMNSALLTAFGKPAYFEFALLQVWLSSGEVQTVVLVNGTDAAAANYLANGKKATACYLETHGYLDVNVMNGGDASTNFTIYHYNVSSPTASPTTKQPSSSPTRPPHPSTSAPVLPPSTSAPSMRSPTASPTKNGVVVTAARLFMTVYMYEQVSVALNEQVLTTMGDGASNCSLARYDFTPEALALLQSNVNVLNFPGSASSVVGFVYLLMSFGDGTAEQFNFVDTNNTIHTFQSQGTACTGSATTTVANDVHFIFQFGTLRTSSPSRVPSMSPVVSWPSSAPSRKPGTPTTAVPSRSPTKPTSARPSFSPSRPTAVPSSSPSKPTTFPSSHMDPYSLPPVSTSAVSKSTCMSALASALVVARADFDSQHVLSVMVPGLGGNVTKPTAQDIRAASYNIGMLLYGYLYSTAFQALDYNYTLVRDVVRTTYTTDCLARIATPVDPAFDVKCTEMFQRVELSSMLIAAPTASPTHSPTVKPTTRPTGQPSTLPTQLGATHKPSFKPSKSPSTSPTAQVPQFLNATFSPTYSSVYAYFDIDTNMAGLALAASVNCSTLVTLTNDAQCPTCANTCSFTDPRTLKIRLSASSLFPVNGNVTLLGGKVFSKFPSSKSVRGTRAVSSLLTFPVPVVQITGPNQKGSCSPSNLALMLTTTGSGGRLLTVSWTSSLDGYVAVVNNASLVLGPSTINQLVTYSVTATNWLGKSSTPVTYNVTYINGIALVVQLSAPPLLAMLTTTALDVTGQVALPASCNVSNPTFTYMWKLTNDAAPGIDITSTLTKSTANHVTGSLSIGAYTLQLTVLASGTAAGGSQVTTNGTATTHVTVSAAPMVAILTGASALSVTENKSVTLDVSRSCDPNVVVPPAAKCTVLGVLDPAAVDVTKIAVNWTCTAGGVACNTTTLPCIATSCLSKATFSTVLLPLPYDFKATVASVYTPSAANASTSDVLITVQRATANCPFPSVAIASFPARVQSQTDPSAQVVVRASATGGTSAITYAWTLLGDGSLSTLLPAGSTAAGANLVLAAAALQPDTTYTFKLTASTVCAAAGGASFSSFAQVTFQVNSGPQGGALSVAPASGQVALTPFVLTASLFDDPEGDLPLQYSFQARFDMDANGLFVPLVDFSLDFSSTVYLQLPSAGNTVALVAVSRDALGAQSGSGATGSVTVNPIAVAADAFNATSTINSVTASGGDIQVVLQTIAALAGAVVGQENETVNASTLAWQQSTLTTLLSILVNATGELTNGLTPGAAAVEISTMLSVIEAGESVGLPLSFVNEASDLVNALINATRTAVNNLVLGSDDPQAQSLVPNTVGQQSLYSLDSTLKQLLAAISPDSRRRRRLDDASSDKLRDSVRSLVQLVMTGAVAGSPQVNLPGVSLQMAVLRETVEAVGAATGVSELVLPGFDNDPPTVFVFPANVLQNAIVGIANETDELNLVAVRFRINIDELGAPGNVAVNDSNAPNSTIEEFVSLDFQLTDVLLLHPQQLAIDIQIINPLNFSDVPVNLSKQHMACGYWDTVLNGWTSAGCNVTNVTYPKSLADTSGSITCSCNHASDYAVWQAFSKDVQDVFHLTAGELEIASTIAALVIGLLIPALIVTWLVLLLWARSRDIKDADVIHRGTFTLVTLNKIRLHHRQRKLFKLLRAEAAKGLVAGEHAPRFEHVEKEPKYLVVRLARRLIRALYFESSLVGLVTRFDPYYERTQRVSVLVGIIIGNLFANCFLYKLNQGNVSAGLFVGRTLLASVLVAIPVRIFIKALFKITASRQGSTMDRVIQIFRVSAFTNDVMPSAANEAQRLDIQLLNAFKRMYTAKLTLRKLLIREAKMRGERPSAITLAFQAGSMTDVLSAPVQSMRTLVVKSKPVTSDVEAPTQQDIAKAQTELKEARKQLVEATAASKEHLKKQSFVNGRAEFARQQKSTLLKLAAILADEPGPRPLPPGRLTCPSGFIWVAWFLLFAYYLGTAAYVCFWVLTRENETRISYLQTLEYEQTAAQISRLGHPGKEYEGPYGLFISSHGNTNASQPPITDSATIDTNVQTQVDGILLNWLASSALGVLFMYFLVEPIMIIMRFSVFPWMLRRWGRPKTGATVEPTDAPRAAGNAVHDAEMALAVGVASAAAVAAVGTAGTVVKGSFWDRSSEATFDFLAEVVNSVVYL